MKLHLPPSLRRCLLAVMTIAAGITGPVAQAGIRHSDVLLQTYTDFGQNKGRYTVGTQVNALLQYIRNTEGGISISYTDGQPDFIISNEQGMINFSGAVDGGPDAAIGPNYLATVAHNGANSASYGERVVGGEHALNYQAIDIRGTGFRLIAPDGMWGGTHDYMLQRQSKVQTDVVWNPISTITDAAEMNGNYIYHSGGGSMSDWVDGTIISSCGGYAYIIGGIMTVTGYQNYSDKGSFVLWQNLWYGDSSEGASETHPMPNAVAAGDSGSPVYIYNEATRQYEYVGAQEAISGHSHNWTAGNTEWTAKTMESFNVHVDMSAVNTVYLNAIAAQGDTISMDGYSTTIWTGAVTNAAGDSLASYKGVKTGLNTWNDLSNRKDVQNWYAYNASGGSGGYLNQSIPDLFYNENLVFDAAEGSLNNSIVLKDTVDLGIGYAEFNGGRFTITSESGENNQFDHAGYVINEGAEVHLQLRNPDNRMTEWRKIGAGDLYIDGTGNTNALLNLGGTGTTYLQQQNGYAAYNVLANTGATVVIQDLQQIVRDFTFGAGGGTLDMHGNSMEWRTTSDAEGRFTINALTEEAMISNSSGNVTLTYTESGDSKYLGSFRDTKDASLTIDYQGGGTWELNSIHTNLSNNDGSGLIVSNGKVLLTGTHTVHGMGSLNGKGGSRLELANDWHYADAAMDVAVKDGATFELGSHARLTGDVTVDEGATFIMREGVQHRMEYVEGGVSLEDTNQYAAYFGLKGNVELGGDMRVEFSAGADSRLSYNGDISGAGSLSVALGTEGGILELGGDNSGFIGTKTIESGGVVLLNTEAMGDTTTNKWIVSADAWIANQSSCYASLLAAVDESSTGTLALWADTFQQLDMSRHEGLTLGAAIGRTVQYGELGTQEELNAVQGAWRFGGGGGELVVNYKLSGENDLILGASGQSSGVVTLTNTQNDFSGDITFTGKGIVLNAVEGALGNAALHLAYGNGFGLPSADSITKNVDASAQGMVTVDAVSNQQLDMSGHHSLAIAAEKDVAFSGGITLATGQGYLFSAAIGGKLTLLSELDSSRSLVVDAQGLTGGTVVLAGNDSWSGDITVRGHRDNNGEGEINLLLGQDMTSAGRVTLSQGGILDLAGHSLTVTGTLTGDGGVLTNSGKTGELIFDSSASELSSTANLAVSNIRKIGDNVLSLGGNNAQCQFYVEEGTLRMVSDGALASGSTVHLGDGTALDNRTHALNANVAVSNGAAQIISSNNDKIVIRGNVHLADGVQLTLGGSNTSSVTLGGENIGTNGSSLIINANRLILDRQSAISVNSDLIINGNATIYSSGSADAMGRNFERIIVNGGKLTIGEESWSTVWNINSLKGSGELYWESTTNHYSSSRLILKGDSDFDGTISLNRTYNQWASRTHGAFLELASDFAAAKARINLTGRDSNSVASLAINTDNAHIKGLSGNGHSFVYAGASRVDTALSGSARPETSRAATLTIDTAADSNYTFSGSIGNTTDTSENGITLVKTGSGTQTLNGASVVLSNVGALAGTLNITSSALTVSGNVALARGAALKLGDSYSLNEGQKLYLMAGAENSGAAVFNSALVFNGGSVIIDARGLSETSPMLALGGTVSMNSSFDGSCQFDFTRTANVSLGTDYLVSNDDWSLLNNRISAVTDDYVNATFTASATGLSVMFSLNDGYFLWDGDEGILQRDNKVVFTGSNGVNNVNLTENAELGNAYFNNAEDVFINGAALGINFLQKQDSGALVLNADVSAENMVVKNVTTISGTGSLTVGSLTLQDDVPTYTTEQVDTAQQQNASAFVFNTDVRATSMVVKGATTIGGTGSLTVGSLILQGDITTRMAVQFDNLQADGVTWTVDGTDKAFTQSLTLEQLNTTGGVNVEGQATLELSVTGGNYDNPRTLGVEIGGTGYISLVGNGSLRKTQQQHINLSHAELSNLILKGGATNICGEVNINGRLSVGREKLRLTEGAQVTVTHFRGGDTEANQPSIVTIDEGASLKITGSADGDNTGASFLLSHWANSSSTLVLNGGTITSEGARLHMGWDSSARFEALSGEATLKGISFSTQRYHSDTLVLGEARLNIGSGGITGIGFNDSVLLGNGTIAATANFSISGNNEINLVGTAGGTIFDTAGHTITVNTVLQGEGNLVKTGAGTLNFAAENTFTGSVTVQAGTLQLSAAQTAHGYEMAEGTTLSVTHAQGEMSVSELSGNAALYKDGSGVLNLGEAQVSALTLKGNGSTAISGEVSVAGLMEVGTESVVLADGADVSANQLRLGTSARDQHSILSIDAGATLTVTGGGSADAESVSLLLAHWHNSASTMILNGGTLNAQNASMHMGWDSTGTFSAKAGVANLNGILFSSARGNSDTFVLGEARLNIGSGGITGIGSNDTVQFGNGTIAATANFSISGNKAIDLVGTTNGTVFDTAGHTITVNTALAGNGNLVKTGNGTLNLAAATSLRGDVTLQAGTLQISNNSGTTELAHLAGEGMLTKTGSGSLTLNTATVSTIVLQGSGQTDITGDVNISEQLSIGNQTVNIQSGAVVTTSRLTASDRGSYVSSTININGGALNITGTVNNANTQNSFFLTHWTHSTSVLNLYSGMLNAVGAVLNTSWDSRGSFNAIGGEANLLGINLLGHEFSGRNGAFTLGSQDEGSAVVRIGSMGITGLTGGASVTLGNGTIAAAANFSISGNKAIDLVGTTNGTVFDTAGHTITVNTALAGNGNLNKAGDGTLNLNASTAQYTGNVNINGGTLMLGSNALGVLTSGSELVVNKGGKLDLSAATIASGTSTLLNRVSGAGTVVLNYGVDGNGTAFDFRGLTGEVQVDSGRVLLSNSEFGSECPDFRLTSSDSQLVFNGNGTVVNSNVYLDVESTDIHVNADKSGTIGGDIIGNSLVKQGGGTLTVGGNMKLDAMLSTRAGEVILTGEDNSITNVDGAMSGGNTAKGKLRLAQNARLQVTGNIWGRSNTGILLDSGAEVNISGQNLSIANHAEEGSASLAATTSNGPGLYGIGRTDYQISNAHVAYTGGDATIGNKLVSSSVENAGSGLLTVDNGQNRLVGLNAASGSILVQNLAELDLKNLEIANSLSVSAYADGSQSAAAEACISVSEIASFGTGVTLNADLVMKTGSTLRMAGAVQMGSDVHLETGLSLTGSLYDEVKSMKAGESVTLFTGVDALYLGSSQTAITSITLEDGVLAKDYFTNLSDHYFLIYDTSLGDGLGELSIGMVVPEPTTATLSLVALAALAMRRRRK